MPPGTNKKQAVDINCDIGEGMPSDALIMLYISSANIACGFHAGDAKTMYETIQLALHHRVKIGAHISFDDRENFGRKEMYLNSHEIEKLVREQLEVIQNIAKSSGTGLHHVKPHGALYNMSAKHKGLAKTIAGTIKGFDPTLVIFGLSGSYSISEAKALGLATSNEVFADRTYQDDGSLTPRSQAGALIENVEQLQAQVYHFIMDQNVRTVSGKILPVVADTICIHGDGPHAVQFAKAIAALLSREIIPLAKPDPLS
jgi:UPF0271 protein